MYLVMLAYSLLMLQLQQNRTKDWALTRLTTIGQARRAMTIETFRTTLEWAIAEITEKKIHQPCKGSIGLDLTDCKTSVRT
jgi:hypothetical protein